MIDKIAHIKNMGKFKDYSASGDVCFRPITLVYAENAAGKTTLCALLRSLCTGDPKWILERQTLGEQDAPDVLVRVAGANARFRHGTWDSTFRGIEVLDPVFVHQNVYAGDAVDFDHRRNLHGFAVGEEGVALAQEIERHTVAVRQLNEQIGNLRGRISGHNLDLVGDDVGAFVLLPAIEDIDHRIEETNRQVEALRRADSILSRELLSELPFPAVPFDPIQDLFARQLDDVSAEAGRRVRQHFSACMDQRGEAWVQQGLAYVTDDRCPFCGQDISAADLVAAYRTYFSAAYVGLKDEIVRTRQLVEDTLSDQRLLALQRVYGENRRHAEFWTEHAPADYPELNVERVIQALQTLKETLLLHLERKLASPLTPLARHEELSSAIEAYNRRREQVEHYEGGVAQVNRAIDAKKRELREADVATAERELRSLQATKLRQSAPVADLCAEYLRLHQEKDEQESHKDEARRRLREYTANVLPRYWSRINEHLARFDADFRIVDTREEFYGGNPSVAYLLEIRSEQIPLVQSEPDQASPCFRNTLSSGDRATLAFAFFLARLDLDHNIQQKVVVFDDPISSLDGFRRTASSQAIRRVAQRASQVIVLSHDPFFLRGIWDNSPPEQRHALSLTRTPSGSSISEWHICQATQTPYERDYFTLQRYLELGPGDDTDDHLRSVARCIRPVLESYIKRQCPPGSFPEAQWLGDMIHAINDCEPDEPAANLKRLVEELSDINEYSRHFHHKQNPNADNQPVTDGELRGFVNRTLELLQQ